MALEEWLKTEGFSSQITARSVEKSSAPVLSHHPSGALALSQCSTRFVAMIVNNHMIRKEIPVLNP
jgi:hypothetical protein